MQDQILTWSLRTVAGGVAAVASTPKTLLQYKASATNTAELLYFAITQSGSTTSLMDQVSLVRKTAAATVTAGVVGTTLFDLAGGASGTAPFGVGSTSGTGYNASAEGTDGDVPFRANFNTLAGYEKDFQPSARLWIPVNGIIAVKISALNSLTWDVTMVIREMK